MKKLNRNNIAIRLVIVALILTFAACKPEPPKPPKQTPPTPPSKGNCELTGVLSNDECLPSIYNGLSIIDDATGIFLAPCESDVPIPQNIKNGDKIEFSYEEIPYGSSCEKIIVCHREITSPYKFVRITCFKTKNSTAQ